MHSNKLVIFVASAKSGINIISLAKDTAILMHYLAIDDALLVALTNNLLSYKPPITTHHHNKQYILPSSSSFNSI